MDFQNTDLRGGSLQISTEVIGKIARCAALKLTALPRFPAADKIKAQGSAGSIQHPVSGRGGNAGWYRKHHSEPDDELWRTHSCCGRKVQENVKNAVQNMTNVTVSRVNLVIAGLAETTAAEK